MSGSVGSSSIELEDLENMGRAMKIAALSIIQAEIVCGVHLTNYLILYLIDFKVIIF